MPSHGRRVGLLGGSFNPAHDGHRHISEIALQRLDLHEVWWMVSPQNPLKPVRGMAPLEDRMAEARRVADHPQIRVTDIERRLGTQYSIDTLHALQARHHTVRFVWLIGADNLIQMPRWHAWEEIFAAVPVAVFARPQYSIKALFGKAALRFQRHRLAERRAKRLALTPPPSWVFLRIPLHPASATAIRAARGNTA